ncbi:MAG: hypothetical protein ACJBCI_03425, partial [Candidatus Tisiphia sp.]
PRPAAYSNVREDSSTDVAYKSPAEVEFRKKSIIFSTRCNKLILDSASSLLRMSPLHLLQCHPTTIESLQTLIPQRLLASVSEAI